jgi:hypothetical protein
MNEMTKIAMIATNMTGINTDAATRTKMAVGIGAVTAKKRNTMAGSAMHGNGIIVRPTSSHIKYILSRRGVSGVSLSSEIFGGQIRRSRTYRLLVRWAYEDAKLSTSGRSWLGRFCLMVQHAVQGKTGDVVLRLSG